MGRRGKIGDRGRDGWFTDHAGTQHHYRSRWELRRMQYLDICGLRFVVEGVRIPYQFEGRPRTYITDLVVTDPRTNTVWIEEIKPAQRNEDPQNLAKWAAARAWCQAAGYRFLVVNADGLTALPPWIAR
jgi:hypothetical protein